MKRVKNPPAAQNQPPIRISLGKPSLRIRLEAYYQQIAPEIVQNNPQEWRTKFQQIYEKFGGSHEGEQLLHDKLVRKYGSSVRLVLAKSVETTPSTQRQHRRPATGNQRPEDFYNLTLEQETNGNISFTSPKFNPFLALASPESAVHAENPWIIAKASILDTVSKFASLLPQEDPQWTLGMVTRKRPPVEKVVNISKRAKQLPPFAALADSWAGVRGPLSFLHKNLKKRIRVLVRYVNSVRGTITGNLFSFDKHMNMILLNAEEVYTPRCVDTSGQTNMEIEMDRRRRVYSSATGTSQDVSWSVRVRRMKQVLVRGDMVVCIYKADEERSCWPHTTKSPTTALHGGTVDEAVPDDERVGTPGSLGFVAHRQQG